MDIKQVKEKRVNVHSATPLSSLKIRVNGTIFNQVFPVEDILSFISEGATVFEVYDDGRTDRLDKSNYNIDLSAHPEYRINPSVIDTSVVTMRHPIIDKEINDRKEQIESDIKKMEGAKDENPFHKSKLDEIKEKMESQEKAQKIDTPLVDTKEVENNAKVEENGVEEVPNMIVHEGIQVITEPGMVLNEEEIKEIEEKEEENKKHKKQIKIK